MNFLHRGERRRGRVATLLTTVGALAVFQALAIVGAGAAFAAGTCTYNPATDTINITINGGTGSAVSVDQTTGSIEFDGAACGSATNSNTVAIIVLGQPSTDEAFTINENGEVPFNTAIAWSIDLGTGTSDDLIFILEDQTNTLALTNGTFDLNGAVGEVLGNEFVTVVGGTGDDTVDGSAASIGLVLVGGAGDDVLSPGTFDGDIAVGGLDSDTLSYSTRTTGVAVVNGLDAGLDANGDGDNDDAGDEEDAIDCFETVVTGSGNDDITVLCGPTTAVPGDGDDFVDGNGDDVIDWSTSSAGMVIDIPNESATGQGTDTWDGVDEFVGSDFDDTMLVDDDAPGPGVSDFSGLGGIDTVDASAATANVNVELDVLDPSGADDLENLIGSPFNDNLEGNDNQNLIQGGDGNDFLDGQPGNDELQGGLGNDTYRGDTGADTVSFRNSPNGVEVDMLAGFATGEGDDAFSPFPGPGPDIEIIVGSDFADTITGGGGTVATNFRFVGRGGRDILTGSGSNDTLKGGAARDVLRGVGGDDTLVGNKGPDLLAGGAGFDIGKGGKGNDTCRSIEDRHSC